MRERVPLSGPGFSVDPSEVRSTCSEQRTKTWTGFPRPLLMQASRRPAGRVRGGRGPRPQIEYLEWHVSARTRRSRGSPSSPRPRSTGRRSRPRPTGVCSSCTGSSSTRTSTMADLFPERRRYDPQNRWNTTDGIVHYVMRSTPWGTCSASPQERAGPRRARTATTRCPYRRDDRRRRRLNFDIWAMTRKGLSVGTDEPAGLYIDRLGRHGLDEARRLPGRRLLDGGPRGRRARRSGSRTRCPPRRDSSSATSGSAAGRSRPAARSPSTSTVSAHALAGQRSRREDRGGARRSRLWRTSEATLLSGVELPAAEAATVRRRCARGAGVGRAGLQPRRRPTTSRATSSPASTRTTRSSCSCGSATIVAAPARGCRWLAPRLATMDEVLGFRARVPRRCGCGSASASRT